jgi:hypothetical protein
LNPALTMPTSRLSGRPGYVQRDLDAALLETFEAHGLAHFAHHAAGHTGVTQLALPHGRGLGCDYRRESRRASPRCDGGAGPRKRSGDRRASVRTFKAAPAIRTAAAVPRRARSGGRRRP